MIIKDTVIRDMGRLFVWVPFRWLIAAAPYGLVWPLAKMVGMLDYSLSRSRRERLLRNIQTVFKSDVGNITRGVMYTHYLNLLEFFKFPGITKENLVEHVFFDGIEKIDRALGRGKGAILATLHFGTMQYPLVALGHLGYKINQVGDRDPDAPEFSFVHRKIALKYRMMIENTFRARHIHISKSLKRIYKCLEENELLMLNVDGIGGLKGQRLKKDYLTIDFLGKRVYMPAGAARVSTKTGSPVLPVVCIRQAQGLHRIIVEDPISITYTNNQEEDILRYTQAILSSLERHIMMYPDHWLLWMEFEKGYLVA